MVYHLDVEVKLLKKQKKKQYKVILEDFAMDDGFTIKCRRHYKEITTSNYCDYNGYES